MWTGILLGFENFNYGENSRISNNPVEAHFNNLRNNILKINKKQKMIRKLMPSQYISRLFKYILFKYYDVYDSEYEKIFAQKAFLIKTNEKFNEKWRCEKPPIFREKGFYYKPNDSFLHLKEINSFQELTQKKKTLEKRLDYFKNFLPKNGGFLKEKNLSIINTCSIDYFLLTISYFWFNNKYFIDFNTVEREQSLINIIEKISDYIKNGEWMKARLEWVERLNLKPLSTEKDCVYDCMLSVFDSFYFEYSEIQQYSWHENCPIKTCKNNKLKKKSSNIFKLIKRNKEKILILDSNFIDTKKKKCQSIIGKNKKCESTLEKSDQYFVHGFPVLLILINNYKDADVDNLPRELNIKKERFYLQIQNF